jgi:hypothetical protein
MDIFSTLQKNSDIVLGVGAGEKPALAVSFASVFLAYGLLSVFPQLQA